MSSQSTDFVMLSLGCQGSAPLLDDGVHLRWQLSDKLPYPPYGFDLLRRAHRSGTERAVATRIARRGRLDLGDVYRSLSVVCNAPAGATIAAFFAGGEMLRVPVSGRGVRLPIAADAIDELEISSGVSVIELRGIAVQDEADLDWGTPLNGTTRIGFPLTDGAYPCRHARAPDDWAEARARLLRPGLPAADAAALEARFGGVAFQQLTAVLRSVAAGARSPIPQGGAGLPGISLKPAQLLALAASDADLARVLGLLWIDRSAPSGTRFDYRVVGYWSQGGTTIMRRCTQVPDTPGTPVTPGTVIQVPVGRTAGGAGPVLGTHVPKDAVATKDDVPLRLTVEAGPTGTVVLTDTPWGNMAAIRWPASLETPIRLRFDVRSEQATLLLSTGDGKLPAIRRIDANGEAHLAKLEVVPAGGPLVVVTVGGGSMAGVEIGTGSTTNVVMSCVQVAVRTGDTRDWTCFDVARAATPVLEAPAALTGNALPLVEPSGGASLARPGALHGLPGLGAGLRWESQGGSTATMNRGAVAFHVHRKSLGNGATPPALPIDLTGFVRVTEDRTNPAAAIPTPVRALPASARPAPPAGWPQTAAHFIDGPLDQRWYAYAVRAIDLFGRLSAPVFTRVELLDRTPPPPPVGVSVKFLDPAVPVGDAEHDGDVASLPASMSDGALVVRWAWPHYRERQSSDVREFRVYWQSGRWNAFPGKVDAVDAQDDWSAVSITLDDGPLPQWMTGGWLRIGGSDAWRIDYTASLRPLRVIVRNRLLRRDAQGRGEAPPLGRCTLVVDTGDDGIAADPNFRDPANITTWTRRVAVLPFVPPPEGHLSALGTTAIVDTIDAARWRRDADGSLALRIARPFRGDTAQLIGATLMVAGVALRVDAAAGGRELLLRVSSAQPLPDPLPVGSAVLTAAGLASATVDVVNAMPGAAALAAMTGGALVTAAGDVLPVCSVAADGASRLVFCVRLDGAAVAANQACAWYPEYEAVIANPGLVLRNDDAQAFGSIAVTAADLRDDVPNRRNDDPQRWGNEGAPTAPLQVMRTRRVSPAAPTMPTTLPAGQGRLQTDDPDFYGRVRYTVEWPASAGAAGYLVLRALDAALAGVDQEHRRTRRAFYQSAGPFDDDAGFAAWFAAFVQPPGVSVTVADLTADPANFTPEKAAAVDATWLAWRMRFYAALTDSQWQALASRAGSERAFGRVNAAPVEVNRWTDEFESSGPDRFLYRIASLDAAGNLSAPGGSTLPVHTPDRVRPAPPVLVRVAGDDRRITLTWLASEDAGVTEYLIHRADSADAARDVRDMTLVQRIPAGAAGSRSREASWTDQPVPAAVPRWYRLCTLRSNGIVSPASEAMAGTAFDATPAPVIAVASLAWRETGSLAYVLDIAWTARPDAELRVQRRAQGRSDWVAVSGWLPGSTASFADSGAEFWLGQDLRIETRLGTAGALGPVAPVAAAVS
jgi:hypothetical protein